MLGRSPDFTSHPVIEYGAILADPPWHFKTWSSTRQTRHARNHYETMESMSDVAVPAADDCALFLWAVDPMLPQAFEALKAWGFKYKTVGFTWVKTGPTGFPIGMGYWSRANPEMCLLATRGKPKRLSKSVPQLMLAPRREHSRKPDEIYDRIEALVSGPYLEMFARQRRDGWDAWGDEVDKFK